MEPQKVIQQGVILVGRKPLMSYALAAFSAFQGIDTVVLKARGRAISRAVDVEEVTKRKFFPTLKSEVVLGTETVKDKQTGRETAVSTIEITLKK
jgi:DNA-binding protein